MKTKLRKALVVLLSLTLALGMSVPAFAVAGIPATGSLIVEGDRLLNREVTAIRMFNITTPESIVEPEDLDTISPDDTGIDYVLVDDPWLQFFRSTTIMVNGKAISAAVTAAVATDPPANPAAIDTADVQTYINSLQRQPYNGELSMLSEQAKIWALGDGAAALAAADGTTPTLMKSYTPGDTAGNTADDVTMQELWVDKRVDINGDGVYTDPGDRDYNTTQDPDENPTRRAKITFNALPTGYYLVFPNTDPVDGEGASEIRNPDPTDPASLGVNAMLVHVPGSLTLKSAFPTVSKSVARELNDPDTTYDDRTTFLENMAGAQIGEILTFKLSTVLPITAGMTEYALTIADKLPAGLELLDSTVGSQDDPIVTVDGIEATGETVDIGIGVNVLPGIDLGVNADAILSPGADYAYLRNTLDVGGLLTNVTGNVANLLGYVGDALNPLNGADRDLDISLDTTPQDAFFIRFPNLTTDPGGLTQDGSVLVEVTYKARVNSLAPILTAMTNTAQIEYDEGAGPEKSAEETFDTYAYSLEILKRGEGEILADATFLLSTDGTNRPDDGGVGEDAIIGMAATADIDAALGGIDLVNVAALPDRDGTYTVSEGNDGLLGDLLPGVLSLLDGVIGSLPPPLNFLDIDGIITELEDLGVPLDLLDLLDLQVALFDTPNIPREVGTDGIIRFEGLGAGTYYLWEMATGNAAYAPLAYPVKIVIRPTTAVGVPDDYSKPLYYVDINGDGNFETEYNGVDGSSVTFTVYNYKDTATLPETGGVGTVGLTILGVVVIAGGVIFTSRKSRRNKQ